MTLDSLLMSLVVVMLAWWPGISIAADKTFRGAWDNNPAWSSTLTFLNESRVKYCFQSDCTVATFQGDPNRKFWFNWGTAKFYFSWDGKGYRGTRNAGRMKNRGYLE